MIRVFIRDEAGSLSDYIATDDPVEAEAHYLRLIQIRTVTPTTAIIDPGRPTGALLPARYRLDKTCSPPEREQEIERGAVQWLPSGSPTVAMVRGLALRLREDHGATRDALAASVGYTKAAWDAWAMPEAAKGHRRIPWGIYTLALIRWGLHPDHALRRGSRSAAPRRVGRG